MRSLKTLVGFVLVLGLLTLGVVGLDYLSAPAALQLAFAILLGAFGLIAFITAMIPRPSAGTILAGAAAIIAVYVAIRDVFMTTLDLLLFALIIFDVIVLFILFGEIDRFDKKRKRRASTARKAPVRTTSAAPAARAKPASASTKKASKTPKKTTKRKTTKRANTPAAAASSASKTRFVASSNRAGGSFHLINCSVAHRIPQEDRAYFATREKALEAGYKPCRICNP